MMKLPGPPIAALLLYAVSVALAGCGDDSGEGEGGEAGSPGVGGATGMGGRDTAFPGMGGALTPTTEGEFYINEVMPSNHNTIQDETGAYPDWIEIYNAADGPASLGNYWLGDDPSPEPDPDTSQSDLLRVQLPEHFVIPAHGVILLFADNDESQGDNHLPFNLAAEGEWVILTDPEGNQADAVQWTELAPGDQSLARTVDGAGEFVWCSTPTPGQPNGTACPQ
jgi:hypothetical protein